jgi:hypothetical protein
VPTKSGPSDPDLVLVESCSNEPVSEHSEGRDSTLRSSSTQPPIAPRPSVVSASLGVASPCADNPLDCNASPAGVSVSPCKVLLSPLPGTSHSPTLVHYPDFNNAASCTLLTNDLGHTKNIWKLCIIGYVVRKFPGYIALNNLISIVWKCFAKLTVHDSGWLVYTFHYEANKIVVLSGGPYSVLDFPISHFSVSLQCVCPRLPAFLENRFSVISPPPPCPGSPMLESL